MTMTISEPSIMTEEEERRQEEAESVGFISTVCTYKEFTFPSVYLYRNRHTAGNKYHNN